MKKVHKLINEHMRAGLLSSEVYRSSWNKVTSSIFLGRQTLCGEMYFQGGLVCKLKRSVGGLGFKLGQSL